MSDGRPKRPLDHAAVQAANEKVWAEFPELKGRQLNMSDSDYKYRRAWREAYQGEVEKKTCPKKPVTDAAITGCSPTTTPLSKEEWQKRSLAAAGIDKSKWDPEKGFEYNQENVKKVYAYYTGLYNQNPKLLWAGMAKLAGGTVYGGLENGLVMKAAAGAFGLPGQIAQGQAQFVENKLVGMQQDIFLDLGWQHQAYIERGICEIDAACRRGDISKRNYEAWLDINSGDPERVWRGNEALLFQEQFNVLDPSYRQIRSGLLGGPTAWVLSMMTQPPIPGGSPFTAVVPGGDVTRFQDRWQWITTDMLPAYSRLTPQDRATLINEPLEQLAARNFAAGPR